MGFSFSSIFKPQDTKAASGKGGLAADESLVEKARTSARRRLIGAVLLLGVGVIAFPLIFETQPRPIPVDIPIEIPRKDGLPPLALPASRPVAAAPASAPVRPAPPAVITETKADAGRPVPAPTEAPAPKPEPTVAAKPAASAPAAVPATPKPAAEATAGRFVVQVGAFADAAVVRETRGKVEKLGLTTYTQVVDTANGPRTRVRIGPFTNREEADKAAAKLKAAGLPGAVLTL